MGGRGSAVGLNKGGTISRNVMSLGEAKQGRINTTGLIMSKTTNSPASDAQIKAIESAFRLKVENIQEKQGALRSAMKKARSSTEMNASYSGTKLTKGQLRKGTFQRLDTTIVKEIKGMPTGKELFKNIKSNLRDLNKDKKSKYANEIISLLRK